MLLFNLICTKSTVAWWLRYALQDQKVVGLNPCSTGVLYQCNALIVASFNLGVNMER